MSTYVILCSYTEQGAKRIKEISRTTASEKWKDVIHRSGGKLVAFYALLGEYDFMVVVEYPSDEVALRRLLSLVMQGDFKTRTCKAFTSVEYSKVVKRIWDSAE